MNKEPLLRLAILLTVVTFVQTGCSLNDDQVFSGLPDPTFLKYNRTYEEISISVAEKYAGKLDSFVLANNSLLIKYATMQTKWRKSMSCRHIRLKMREQLHRWITEDFNQFIQARKSNAINDCNIKVEFQSDNLHHNLFVLAYTNLSTYFGCGFHLYRLQNKTTFSITTVCLFTTTDQLGSPASKANLDLNPEIQPFCQSRKNINKKLLDRLQSYYSDVIDQFCAKQKSQWKNETLAEKTGLSISSNSTSGLKREGADSSLVQFQFGVNLAFVLSFIAIFAWETLL